MIEKIAIAISGAPFPSERSLKRARAALEAIQPEIMKVFESHFTQCGVVESTIARMILYEMKTLFDAALEGNHG